MMVVVRLVKYHWDSYSVTRLLQLCRRVLCFSYVSIESNSQRQQVYSICWRICRVELVLALLFATSVPPQTWEKKLHMSENIAIFRSLSLRKEISKIIFYGPSHR